VAYPYWKYPGTLEGRIRPANSVPCQEADLYYGYAYSGYTYYYSGNDWVFCLGEDSSPFQVYRLQVDDALSVQQTFTPASPHKLLRFCWHMRHPEMPQARDIVSGGEVSFLDGGLVSRPAGWPSPTGDELFLDGPADGLTGILVHGQPSAFTQEDLEQWVTISGSSGGLNDGTFRISGVPWALGAVSGGDRAVLNAPISDSMNDTGVTIRLHGLKWVARLYYNDGGGWEEYLSHTEEAGRTVYRGSLALNISKLSGPVAVKFEMKLERVT